MSVADQTNCGEVAKEDFEKEKLDEVLDDEQTRESKHGDGIESDGDSRPPGLVDDDDAERSNDVTQSRKFSWNAWCSETIDRWKKILEEDDITSPCGSDEPQLDFQICLQPGGSSTISLGPSRSGVWFDRAHSEGPFSDCLQPGDWIAGGCE